MNRTLSGKRRNSTNTGRHRFSIGTFRGLQHQQLNKKMNRVIKSENSAIAAYESAARQRISIAAQISEWGETTEDEAISDISDKLGVLLAEMGEQEDTFAQQLEEYRAVLKHIRDTESSVQPTRDHRTKLSDEIQKLKTKEPNSNKIETMEQELVRAEAQNLVAEAQLTNVTRQRFKEAYSVHLAAVIERGEKQVLLARHARRLLNCLDDSSVVPGDEPQGYHHSDEAKQIIEEAEKSLHAWEGRFEPVETRAHITAGAIPPNRTQQSPAATAESSGQTESLEGEPAIIRQDDAVSETYSHVSANDAGSPARTHSVTAIRMDVDALEGAPAAGGVVGVNKWKQVNGVSERSKVSDPNHGQGEPPAAEEDFAIRSKRDSGARERKSLDKQQRAAVPI